MRIASFFDIARRGLLVFRRQGARALVAKIARALSVGGIAYRLRRKREDRAFDRRHGTDTGGVDHIERLDVVGENGAAGNDHLAAPRDEFDAALAMVDIGLDGLTFVDFGSGKGRALLFAAERPFAKIVGVEFAGALHRVAEANLAARNARSGQDDRFTLIHGDATAFDYPAEPTLLYLFNPFGPPVIGDVAERALAAWRARPRPFRILYMNALHHDVFTAAGWRLLALERGTALFAPPAI